MSLRDPLQKMSKSDPQPLSRILLTDGPDTIWEKLKKSMTDSELGVSYDPKNRPGVSNLIEIYAHMQRRDDFGAIAQEWENLEKKELKMRVAECISEGLKPVREEYERIMKEGDGYLDKIAEKGAAKARESAEKTMVLVRKAMGLA